MNRFNELLDRWAELEPEWCKKLIGNCFKIAINGFDWWSLAQDLNAIDFSPLQWSLQKAIADKDLAIDIHYDPTKQLWCVHLWRVEPDEGDAREWHQVGMSEWLEESAIALLSAYIQALEASVKIGGGSN